jgi:Xaa-Pro aminopeptidase
MDDPRVSRQSALLGILADRDLDGLLVSHLPNIRWLTGFTGSAAILLVAPGRCTLVTDFRYASQAPQEVGDLAEVHIAPRSVWGRVSRLLADTPGSRIGFESHVVTVRDAERLTGYLGTRLQPAAELVESLRMVKDPSEVAAIREAAALAQEALAAVVPTIRVGERELDVASRLEAALRQRGSEWHPFETIVASGPRSALPHARTSERVLERGEFLLLDFGAIVRGYCSDLTRTFVLGPVDPRQRAVYELVESAQRLAREGIRAGMRGRDADALARDPIAERGYGEAFGHSLGHGLGLEVHEAPRLAATSEAALPLGAVVTVEPGIYLPGWGGVRLEDDVWLSPDGPVLLSDGRTTLVQLDA